VEALRGADAVLLSTAAYHGTLAGFTKNALDFAQFIASDEEPYLQDKVVGLIATAGGDLAGANAVGAMVHAVHALRSTVAPLTVVVPQAWKRANGDGDITDEDYGQGLDKLGRLVVEMTAKLRPEAHPLRASA
jgi:FMN reductase